MDATTLQNLNTLVIMALGVFGAFWTVRNVLKQEKNDQWKQSRADLQSDYDRKKEECKDQEKSIERLEDKIDKLEIENQELRKSLSEKEVLTESLQEQLKNETKENARLTAWINRYAKEEGLS